MPRRPKVAPGFAWSSHLTFGPRLAAIARKGRRHPCEHDGCEAVPMPGCRWCQRHLYIDGYGAVPPNGS